MIRCEKALKITRSRLQVSVIPTEVIRHFLSHCGKLWDGLISRTDSKRCEAPEDMIKRTLSRGRRHYRQLPVLFFSQLAFAVLLMDVIALIYVDYKRRVRLLRFVNVNVTGVVSI